MDNKLLILLIAAVVIFLIALFLIKSLVKAALIAVVITVIFRIGWVYTTDEVVNLLWLDKILHPDRVEEFKIFYDNYEERRDEDPIILPKALDEAVRDEIQDKLEKYIDKAKDEVDHLKNEQKGDSSETSTGEP